jgi:hypothetical protein
MKKWDNTGIPMDQSKQECKDEKDSEFEKTLDKFVDNNSIVYKRLSKL